MPMCAGIPTSTYSGTSASSIIIASVLLSPVAMSTNLQEGSVTDLSSRVGTPVNTDNLGDVLVLF